MLTMDMVVLSALFRQQGVASAEQRSLATAEQSHCIRWMPVEVRWQADHVYSGHVFLKVRQDAECCLDSKVLFQLSNVVSPQQSSLIAADECQYSRGEVAGRPCFQWTWLF
ncbi:unnamed protein product [Polarella glacialis]|uniref:Uncharacterized protein n=1 Tax=Polarella glacialis TaxID=89957 RepID=A0A813GPZ0_POLGL|nr:unnamed protein product [Polarella glacialis]